MPLTHYFDFNDKNGKFIFFFLTQHSSFHFHKSIHQASYYHQCHVKIENRITCSQRVFTESVQHVLSAKQVELSETNIHYVLQVLLYFVLKTLRKVDMIREKIEIEE